MVSYVEALEIYMIEARTKDIINQMKNIPMSSEYHASRYDTDNEYVIHIWDNKKNSYDIRVKKWK